MAKSIFSEASEIHFISDTVNDINILCFTLAVILNKSIGLHTIVTSVDLYMLSRKQQNLIDKPDSSNAFWKAWMRKYQQIVLDFRCANKSNTKTTTYSLLPNEINLTLYKAVINGEVGNIETTRQFFQIRRVQHGSKKQHWTAFKQGLLSFI